MNKNKKRAVLCLLAAQPFVIKNSVNTSAIGLSALVKIGTTAWDWGGKALEYLDNFASKGQGYMNTVWLISSLSGYARNWYNQTRCFFNKTTLSTPAEFRKKFEEACKEIKGQEKQKRDLLYFGLGAIHDLSYNERIAKKGEGKAKVKVKCKPKCVMLTGRSGNGKTKMAEAFAKAYSSAPPFILSSSNIDANSGVSVVDQLFGTGGGSSVYGGYGGYGGRYREDGEENSFISYIKRVKYGVIIVNEYDKMVIKMQNSKQNKNGVNSLDEVFRTMFDGDPVYWNGKKLIDPDDLANVTFILTSNEKKQEERSTEAYSTFRDEKVPGPSGTESNLDSKFKTLLLGASANVNTDVKENISSESKVSELSKSEGKEKKEGNDEKGDKKESEKEKVNGVDFEEAREATDGKNAKERKLKDLSRTNVERDQSFLNRIKIIELDDLTLENFEEIAKDQYGDDMINYWKEYANIDLDLSKIYKPVAKKASTMPEHGRAVESIMRDLTGLLSTTFEEYLEKNESKRGRPKRVVVNYDEKTNTFSIENNKGKGNAPI